MSESRESFHIIGKKETIALNNPEALPLEDGSLLMQWEERGDLHYATAIMPGYTGVRNLEAEEAWKLFNYKNAGTEGLTAIGKRIDQTSPTLLLPLQAGVCPFDCKGCPFAAHAPETQGKTTKQISPEEIRVLIKESLAQSLKHNIDVQNIGIAFVGSGDATPNQHLEEILEMIKKDFATVPRVRVSTVGGMVRGAHPTPMQVLKRLIESKEYDERPIFSIQISAHSTDEDKRAAHVYEQKLNSQKVLEGKQKFTVEDAKELLLPLGEIAKQFKEIIKAQKDKGIKNIRKPSLTFVCNRDTEINVRSLQDHGFSPEDTVIQLRPLLSEDPNNCMNIESFLDLYNWLRDTGYDVVIMPVSPSGVELMAG